MNLLLQRRVFQCITLLLFVSATVPSAVAAQDEISSDHVAAANCIRNVLRSDPSVDAISLYRIDGRRSAVEFTFHDDYGSHVGDLELLGTFNNVGFAELTSGTVDAQSTSAFDLVSRLDIAQKCSMMGTFDNLFVPLKPRAKWQRLEWPSPSPDPSITPKSGGPK
jgi:hypothetical protein